MLIAPDRIILFAQAKPALNGAQRNTPPPSPPSTPTTGSVAIAGENLTAAEAFNALGQRVATATGKGELLQIDLSGLPAGVYFVNITDSEGRRCVRKVVKE